MKIKDTEIRIIKGKAGALKVDAVVDIVLSGSDEKKLRQVCSKALFSLSGRGVKSVALNLLWGKQGLPLVGASKIMAQEIMKFCRGTESCAPTVREIVICIEDEKTFETFNTTVRGYLDHIQDDLGSGPYATVDIIIELDEGIILIERSNPPYGWALPGGFVDCGESLEETAVREAREETSMELESLRQFHTYSAPDRDPRFHTVSTVFIAKGKGTPQFGDDAKGLKVVKYEELLTRDYAFDHKQIIQDYLKERK